MNDQFYQEEELELWGNEEGTQEEVLEEPQEQEHEDRSPEEFEYNEEEDYGFENEEEPKQEEETKDDYLTKFLKSRNIDREKIRFQNEDGTIEEVRFDDLEDNEKLAILSEEEELPITDQEIEDINYLRDHDINLADFAKLQREQAIKEYLEQNSTPQYEVDGMTDDQLFVYDLLNRYGEELTDEEIDAELAHAKENEDLFTKKMNFLRNQYKEQETASKQATEAKERQQYEVEKQELINALTSAAINTTELQGVELEDADRNEVLDFLLREDTQGRTEFSKLLSDPEAIFKMAWYMKYGESTFNTTVDYFKNELAKARRAEPKQTTRTIIRKPSKPKVDPYGLDSVFK